jgi:hypothetical protein
MSEEVTVEIQVKTLTGQTFLIKCRVSQSQYASSALAHPLLMNCLSVAGVSSLTRVLPQSSNSCNTPMELKCPLRGSASFFAEQN